MKMRRMGPETTELGFQDLGFPPYILGTLAENLSHFGYSLVLSLTQERVHTHTHTTHTPHTHTHTHTHTRNLSHFGYSLVLSLTQECVHTHTPHTHHTHTHTPDKAVFPCWLFQVPRAGNRLQGNSQEIMPSR